MGGTHNELINFESGCAQVHVLAAAVIRFGRLCVLLPLRHTTSMTSSVGVSGEIALPFIRCPFIDSFLAVFGVHVAP